MGQQSGKDAKLSKRSKTNNTFISGDSTGRSSSGSTNVGLRPGGIRENILQQPARHRDPMMEPTLLAAGSVGASNSGRNSVAAVLSATAAAGNQKRYPVVLRYADKDVKDLLAKRQKMFVAVEALDWRPMPMSASEDSFYAVLELPPGDHKYRFLVDGKETVDSSQPMAPTPQDGVKEAPTNFMQLSEVLLMTKEDEEIMDDGEGWGQNHVMFEETRKHPPIVPVHLRYTPLNTPPTAVRCTRDGFMSSAGEVMPPEHLPLPLNVTINHVYFQRREDHSVMGLTTRYCNKYTTVVYYSKMDHQVGE